MVILDLEDSVARNEKAEARARVAAAVRLADWGERVVCVRVNGWEGDATHRDVAEVVLAGGSRLDTVMLPKIRRAEEVVALELLLDQLEREARLPAGGVGIEVAVETAPALADARSICAASPRVESASLGPADLAASLGVPTLSIGRGPTVSVGARDAPGNAGDPHDHVLVAILVAARASGVQALDGPYAVLGDEAGLRASAERSRRIGYDGKWAIHPEQLPLLGAVYSPREAEVARAEEILDALDEAERNGRRGAVRSSGEMVDAASRQLALRTLRRAGRVGPGPALGTAPDTSVAPVGQ